MTSSIQPRPRNKRSKFRLVFWCLLLLILCASLVVGSLKVLEILEERRPSTERIVLDFNGMDRPVFFQGRMLNYEAVGENESLMLPFDLVKNFIYPSIFYEEETKSTIITTTDKVIRLRTDQLTAMINEEPMSIRFPIEEIDDMIYLPITPLLEYFDIKIRVYQEDGPIFLLKPGDLIQWGKIIAPIMLPDESIAMRTETSIKAPIAFDLMSMERVMILEETNNGWYHIQLDSGYKGYVEKVSIQLDGIESIPFHEKESSFVPWKPMGEKINLTWEKVIRNNPNTDNFGPMPGLNVVSPTWFHLAKDGEGNFFVKNLASAGYVKWAHERGYQVWALFSNDFNPDMTSEALSTYDNRMIMIKQLLAYAEMYDVQGINIDFENVHLKDKDLFTQFVREMTPFMHEQGLVISIDVTIRGGSPMWSLFADRREIGKVVDYMIVMTYDEHWAASPIAGSVASLPWVEKGIVDIMRYDDVPASKLILGVPFYTRIWDETIIDGQVKVSSRAWYMEWVKNLIRDRNLIPIYLEDMGQNYVEYVEDGKTFKIWIEDEVSMKSRIEIVNKYDLAGVASWRRGFETPEIWEVINDTMIKR